MYRDTQTVLDRRAVLAVSARFGLKAAVFAFTHAASMGSVPAVAAFVAKDAAAQHRAKWRLRMGAGLISPNVERYVHTGVYNFVNLVEQLSEGEVHIQVIDQSGACSETTCGERVANGILDIGLSSPQNLGSVIPFATVLDYPFLWTNRTEYLNFLFSPEANALYRDPLRKIYGIEPLFGSGEMRSLFLGAKYLQRALVRTPRDLAGAKIRITNSDIIACFARSLKMNPIPLAFTELLEGLKSGLVDATETWPGAAVAFGLDKVVTQDIAIDFCPGFELLFMSSRVFERLPSSIKEVFYEASWRAMQQAYVDVAEAQNRMVGNGPSPDPGSSYSRSKISIVRLTQAERQAFVAAGSVESNSPLYDVPRKNLDAIGGMDTFGALKEFQSRIAGQPLKPQKWWV